jgi:hypothetical protein
MRYVYTKFRENRSSGTTVQAVSTETHRDVCWYHKPASYQQEVIFALWGLVTCGLTLWALMFVRQMAHWSRTSSLFSDFFRKEEFQVDFWERSYFSHDETQLQMSRQLLGFQNLVIIVGRECRFWTWAYSWKRKP